MSIAVISDLHLGARRATDAFGHDDAEFLRFLRFLEGNFQQIVLLGDIWETLTGGFPPRATHELAAARAHHNELARRFQRPQYRFIRGNHDWVTGRAERAPDELRLRVGGVRILFTHGHQSDALVTHARAVSELGVWLGGWLRRAGLDALYSCFDRLDQQRSQHALDKPSRVEHWAVARARELDVDVVVTGHTHIARRAEHGAQLFLNSGSCAGGALSFLSLEPHAGRYEVHTSF